MLKTSIVSCLSDPITETYSLTAVVNGTGYLAAESFVAISFSYAPVSALVSYPELIVSNLNPGDQITMVLELFALVNVDLH